MPPVLAPDMLVRAQVPSEFKARAEGDQLIIEGYASLFDVRAVIGNWYVEIIRRGAFRDAIEGKDDVRCLWQHDSAWPLGRNKAGTLKLAEDSRGLLYTCTLGNVQWARDAYEAIKRGDVTQSSFGFSPIEERWTWHQDEMDVCERIRVRLWDVSPVTFPAYEGTDVSARDRSCHERAKSQVLIARQNADREAKVRALRVDAAAG